jgi:hypothetical protein
MSPLEMAELRSRAASRTTMEVQGVGLLHLQPVRTIDRLLRSGTVRMALEASLSTEVDREQRLQEMLEDDESLAARLGIPQDDVTLACGIAGPFKLVLPWELERMTMDEHGVRSRETRPLDSFELRVAEFRSLITPEAATELLERIDQLSGVITAPWLRSPTNDQDDAKSEIKKRYIDAHFLAKEYGTPPSVFLLMPEAEFEHCLIAFNEGKAFEKLNQPT